MWNKFKYYIGAFFAGAGAILFFWLKKKDNNPVLPPNPFEGLTKDKEDTIKTVDKKKATVFVLQGVTKTTAKFKLTSNIDNIYYDDICEFIDFIEWTLLYDEFEEYFTYVDEEELIEDETCNCNNDCSCDETEEPPVSEEFTETVEEICTDEEVKELVEEIVEDVVDEESKKEDAKLTADEVFGPDIEVPKEDIDVPMDTIEEELEEVNNSYEEPTSSYDSGSNYDSSDYSSGGSSDFGGSDD